ncbi:hypothetical protein ACLBWS_05925 [Brucellaceae bacterium D45D]
MNKPGANTIPDAAVEAAAKKIAPYTKLGEMAYSAAIAREVLTAAIPHLGWRVRELEWTEVPGSDGKRWKGEAQSLTYNIEYCPDRTIPWELHSFRLMGAYLPTLEAAKSAAQADFQRRASSMLEAGETKPQEPWGWVIPRSGDKKPVILEASKFDQASAAAEADIHDLGYFPLYAVPQDTADAIRALSGSAPVEPFQSRVKPWAGRMVHIQTENGVWRTGGHGYTYAGKPDAWVLPFEDAVKKVGHCGPEKEATFIAALSTVPTSAAPELVTVACLQLNDDAHSMLTYRTCPASNLSAFPVVTRENALQREAVLVARNSFLECSLADAKASRDDWKKLANDLEARLAAERKGTAEAIREGLSAVAKMRTRAETAEAEADKLREALQSIDNLDEAMGHNLTVDDAFTSVAIARQALAKEGQSS